MMVSKEATGGERETCQDPARSLSRVSLAAMENAC